MNKEIKNAINFLKEYEQLCQKYKIGLRGCGCCGSPYLDFSDDYTDINYVNYDFELNKIKIDDELLDEYLEELKEVK